MLYKIYLFFKLIKFKLRFKQRLHYIYSRFNDTKKTLVYIHVGKCGGASLKPSIYKSQIVQNSFKKILFSCSKTSHIKEGIICGYYQRSDTKNNLSI